MQTSILKQLDSGCTTTNLNSLRPITQGKCNLQKSILSNHFHTSLEIRLELMLEHFHNMCSHIFTTMEKTWLHSTNSTSTVSLELKWLPDFNTLPQTLADLPMLLSFQKALSQELDQEVLPMFSPSKIWPLKPLSTLWHSFLTSICLVSPMLLPTFVDTQEDLLSQLTRRSCVSDPSNLQ